MLRRSRRRLLLLGNNGNTGAPPAAAGFTTITDSFTGADGTAIGGRTTDTGGKLWTAQRGTFQILSNQAAPNSVALNNLVTFDAGVSDATFSFIVGPSQYSGLTFRGSDASTYWILAHTGGTVILYTTTNGGTSTTTRKTVTQALASTDRLGVVCSGDTYQLVLNGANLSTPITVSFNATGTLVGLTLMGGSASARWDDLLVTVP